MTTVHVSQCSYCARRAVTSWREGDEHRHACRTHEYLEQQHVSRLLNARKGDPEEW